MRDSMTLLWVAIAAVAAYFYWMMTATEDEADTIVINVDAGTTDPSSQATTWLGSVVDTFQGDTTDTVLGGVVDVFQSFFR
jgi:hypothetical protein